MDITPEIIFRLIKELDSKKKSKNALKQIKKILQVA